MNSGEIIWSTTKETIEVLIISDQEEADRRLIFHPEMNGGAVFIAVKDTKVFLLLIHT